MGGGGSSSKYPAPVQATAPKLSPVPVADIQPNMGSAFGPTATANPYVAGNTPSWANGWFQMPSWGMDPFGQSLTQEQMMYQRPPELDANMQAQQQQQAPQPTQLERMLQNMLDPFQGSQRAQIAGYGAGPMGNGMAMYGPTAQIPYETGYLAKQSADARRMAQLFGTVGGKDGAG